MPSKSEDKMVALIENNFNNLIKRLSLSEVPIIAKNLRRDANHRARYVPLGEGIRPKGAKQMRIRLSNILITSIFFLF